MKIKKKENIVIIALLILMILAIGVVSYAAFSFSKIGTKVNSITTGSITMSYEESDNTITLNGALPTTDETGKKRLTDGEYFDFTVSSKIVGDVNINYEISAKDVTTSSKKIDGSNIKLYLTKLDGNNEEELMSPRTYSESTSDNSYTGRPSREMSLYQGSMSSSETNKYRLRMWVDEEYNPQGDGGSLSFSVKVNVYGKDGNPEDLYKTIADTLLTEISEDNLYDDGVDTFITGEDPNNYIWYSGKLWRAVSVNNETKATKLVTQWNISTITYNPDNQTNFEGSYMEQWLNDTTVDGFLGNLRDYENFIVTDAVWDATMDGNDLGSIQRPNGTTTVIASVGLLNMYEYQSSNNGETNGYLNNGLYWWTLTPYSASYVHLVFHYGYANYNSPSYSNGVRPSINLKYNVKIVDGDGTVDNPYRLEGDNDSNLSGTKLSTRYSGEYIRFGNNENNLYRIVSHEMDGQTKITSEKPLKEKGAFKITDYGMNSTAFYHSMGSNIGAVLVGDLSTYLDNEYIEMIVDSNDWYLGTVGYGVSYKLAKYTDENMSNLVEVYSDRRLKVGLLRYGELMAGQFDRYGNNTTYWTLTPYDQQDLNVIIPYGNAANQSSTHHGGVKPSMNLKTNVVITGGNGTKNNPFTLELK